MTDEWEIVNFNLMFEQQLARDYMQNPNPEYAKHLLELAAAHKTNSLGYPMSDELKQFLVDCAQEFATNFNTDDSTKKLGTKAKQSFGLANKMGRPSEEQKQIVMNAHTWGIVLKGEKVLYALEETAEEFHTTFDTTKAAWEKKNHQFGERELCRVGLDVYLVMNNRTLTPEEEKIATKYLKEEVSYAAIQNVQHIRAKYKYKYKFKRVDKKILNHRAEESKIDSDDG